ncbi:hypothetical protein M9979_13915 [Sphingomonas sp. RP10(2022)]|uniref:Uncharacterized protein n=1 Tax=Sphingomonas liriopis TaxID=2949094 RepID=A0A9X2HZY0_9SPHN|nr:hypothetical protein [Sphingomonas liriopis]MCP3735965.1 hypothetical protein [Sphingomonas liriopis]
MMTADDMKNSNLQSSMSLIQPPFDPEGVPAYLDAAARALGAPSDAGLARTMGVRPHIIANWRRRKAVPESYCGWFRSTLVEKIGTYNTTLPDVSLEARAAVVLLIAETRGDPVRAGSSAAIAAGLGLGGLLALAQFLVDLGAGWESERLVALMLPLMSQFRQADQLRYALVR